MSASVLVQISDSSGRSQTDLNNKILRADSTNPKGMINDLLDYLSGIESGHAANMDVSTGSAVFAAASATVTLASVLNNDTVTINGVVFTAKTAAPVGDQFLVGVSNTADAAALAACINASTTAGAAGVLYATSALAVVTVYSVVKGVVGNAISIASSNGGRLAVAGTSTRNAVTYLSGGTGGNPSGLPSNYVFAG